MSDSEESSREPKSTAFGALGLVINNPLAADSKDKSGQPEPESNEIIENIIKDAGQVVNQENGEFDDENIQRQMSELIHDLQSESIIPDDQNLHPRKSITSAHLIDNDENSSTPAIVDSSSNNPPPVPVRSMSESALVDSAEQQPVLPIQQDQSSIEDDDDNQQSLNPTKQNSLVEPPRSGNTSRIQSASNKRPPSATSSKKHEQLPNETSTDTDREIANESRRSSGAKSPLHRPRSGTPEDSRKTPTHTESPRVQSSSSNHQKEEQNQTFEPPTATVPSTSRPASANKTGQQQSRPPSVIKSKLNDTSSEPLTDQSNHDFQSTSEQSKLIKPGEQLQIPTNDIDNEGQNSPPPSPSPSITKKMVLENPLLETNPPKTDQESSRPSSQTNRESSRPGSQTNRESPQPGSQTNRESSRPSSPTNRESSRPSSQTNRESPQPGSQANRESSRPSSQTNRESPQPGSQTNRESSRPSSETNRESFQPGSQANRESSRPGSQTNRKSPELSAISNEKVIDGDAVSTKSRPSSNTSQQRPTIIQQKPNSPSSRKGSSTSENDQKNKTDSRRSSTDADVPVRTSAKSKQERILSSDKARSPSQKYSAQQSRKNSSKSTDQTTIIPMKINSPKSREQNEKHSSTTDSENEQTKTSTLPRILSPSPATTPTNEQTKTSTLPRVLSLSPATTPTNEKQTTTWIQQVPIPSLQTTEDEAPAVRPQSPNVEQIAERNQLPSGNKKQTTNEQKKKDQNRLLRRSNSAESFNHIPLVDEKSLGSTSDNNTESEHPKQRRVKSKNKNVETSTDSQIGNHHQQQQQQQQEATSPKSSQTSKSMSDQSPSIRRRISSRHQNVTTPDTEPDTNVKPVRRSVKKSKAPSEDEKPVDTTAAVPTKNLDSDEKASKPKEKQHALKSSLDHERHTQSDTEQIVTDKQKKRRRPKRISRTSQTYESVFRRMEREQHEELRPTNDTDKNIQTRRSCLRPRTRSPKRHYPFYLSTDAFKIEEILPKQFPQSQRNTSKTSLVSQNNMPQTGKLLILRPTLPFHHTDAVNVQRISLQYSIDLIPNENRSNDTTPGQRNKTNGLKQLEQTSNLPMIRSPSSSSKTNTKEKSVSNKTEDRTHQRKNGGAV